MIAVVDKVTCIGCGLCADICGNVFSMDVDGKAVARETPVSQADQSCAEDAAEQCPVAAIRKED